MKTTVPTSAPTTRRPGGNDTRAALRHGTGRRDPEHFDPLAIVIDPEVPGAVRDALRARPSHGHSQAMTPSHDQLVRFRDNRPDVPRPPRSRATATMLGWLAAALGILSIAAGIIVSADAFLVLFVLAAADAALAMAASAAARKGKPSFAGGLIPLPPASDLTGYHVMCAGRIYHRRYVRPRVDFDPGALTAWHRAVGAANLIYRAESVRDRVVDTERAEAEVPELLWKIAEGLAKLSDVRIYLKEIVPGAEQFHPAVEAKIKAQERYLARCSGQVSRRIGRLQTVAGKLAAADAARRDEELLKRLVEVEPRILDLVASTDESSTEIDMGEGLKLDADALTEVTNQAINDLSVRHEEGRPSASPSPSRL